MGRENARRARPSLRCQPFAYASASASRGSSAARRASERSRSRSVGADSIGHVRRASGRRVVARRTSSGVEELADRLPERARLARRSVVRGGLTHEREEPARPACTPCRRGSDHDSLRPAARAGRRACRRARGASRRRRRVRSDARRGSEPCSRPITNTASNVRVRARARSRTATRPGAPAPSPRTVARSSAVRMSSVATVTPASPSCRSSSITPRAASAARRSRRALVVVGRHSEPVGVAQHRLHGRVRQRRAGRSSAARASRIGSGRPVRSFVISSIVRSPRSTARPRRRPSRKSTSERPSPPYGVRRNAKRSRRVPLLHTNRSKRQQRLPEGGRAEPRATFDRERHAERAERRLDRCARALDRRADDRDVLRLDAVADEIEDRLGEQLERRSPARPLEEANRAVERDRRAPVLEEVALEVRDPTGKVRLRAGGHLHDRSCRQRAQVVGRPLQRREHRATRLVRQRDVNLPATGERLDQAPFGTGEILEAVREHRRPVPGRRDPS